MPVEGASPEEPTQEADASGTAPNARAEAKPSVGNVLVGALRLYRDNLSLLLLISLVGNALFMVLGVIFSTWLFTMPRWAFWASWALNLPALVLWLWAAAALMVATSDASLGREPELKRSFVSVEEPFWHYVGAVAVYWLSVSIGTCLLLVPGVYLGTIFCFAGYVAVLEGRSVFSAFRRSRRIVRGSFWRVFAVLLVVTAVQVVVSLAIGWLGQLHRALETVASIVCWTLLWPFYIGVRVVLYQALAGPKAEREAPPPEQAEKGGKRRVVLAVLLVLVLAAIYVGLRILESSV